MKAKVKGTNEIVEVKPKGTSTVIHMNCSEFVSEDGRVFPSIYLDIVNEVDWNERRYEIAKEAMTAIMSNAEFYEQVLDVNAEKGQRQIQVSISEASVIFADALIAELQKKQ